MTFYIIPYSFLFVKAFLNFFQKTFLFFFFSLPRKISSAINKKEDKVHRDHAKIQNIERKHIRDVPGKDLPNDPCNVSHNNKGKKQHALPLCGSGTQGFDDIHGPGYAKADHHDRLQNFGHKPSPFHFLYCNTDRRKTQEKNCLFTEQY